MTDYKESYGLIAKVKCRRCNKINSIAFRIASNDCKMLYLTINWGCLSCKKINNTSIELPRE